MLFPVTRRTTSKGAKKREKTADVRRRKKSLLEQNALLGPLAGGVAGVRRLLLSSHRKDSCLVQAFA